jgi:branched-chain amino acid transport system permease protein
MGLHTTLKSQIVMALGGMGNFIGTFVGGILLGATETATAFFIGGNYREVVSLIFSLLILILKPQGLFGVKER